MNTNAKLGVLSRLAARHQAHWLADAWYRRAWFVGPQTASALVLAVLLSPFDLGGPPAAPWSGPLPGSTPLPNQGPPGEPPGQSGQNDPTVPVNKSAVSQASAEDQEACTRSNRDNAPANSPQAVASLAVCTRLIERLPRNDSWLAEAYYQRGRIRGGLQQNDLAIEDMNQAVALMPAAAGALNYRGCIYDLLGKEDLAVADFSAAQRYSPAWSLPVANLANAFLKKRNFEVATEKITEALRLAPRDAYALLVNTRIAFARKQWSNTIADATSVISVAPNSAEAYYLRGAAKEELRDANAALSDLAESERLGYRANGLQNYRGSAYEKLGNIDQAQLAYAASLQIDPKGLFALNRRAKIAFDKNLQTDAEENIEAVLAIDPKNYDALLLRARMSERRGDNLTAIVDVDRVLASSPNDVYATYLRAIFKLYSEIQIIEPCKKYGFITADRSRWPIGVTQDSKCREGPNFQDAIGEIDRALALDKTKPELNNSNRAGLYLARGHGNIRLGNRRQAEQDWRMALGLNPTDPNVRLAMQAAGIKP